MQGRCGRITNEGTNPMPERNFAGLARTTDWCVGRTIAVGLAVARTARGPGSLLNRGAVRLCGGARCCLGSGPATGLAVKPRRFVCYFIDRITIIETLLPLPAGMTAMLDSAWLAVLARFGALRDGFIPPKDMRELRLASRLRRKLGAMGSGQINRLHKTLHDGGTKLGAVVSDTDGASSSAIARGLIDGQPQELLLTCARATPKRNAEELAPSLEGDLSPRHVLQHCADPRRHATTQPTRLHRDPIDRIAFSPNACSGGNAVGAAPRSS